jgi:hypothetical protein
MAPVLVFADLAVAENEADDDVSGLIGSFIAVARVGDLRRMRHSCPRRVVCSGIVELRYKGVRGYHSRRSIDVSMQIKPTVHMKLVFVRWNLGSEGLFVAVGLRTACTRIIRRIMSCTMLVIVCAQPTAKPPFTLPRSSNRLQLANH